jgi:hypothetical protein
MGQALPMMQTGAAMLTPIRSKDFAKKVSTNDVPESVVDNIRQALKGLEYGEITVTVRNGSVTQIERLARNRLLKINRYD